VIFRRDKDGNLVLNPQHLASNVKNWEKRLLHFEHPEWHNHKYPMLQTRSYAAFVVGKLARYTANPDKCHCEHFIHLVRFFRRTLDIGVCYYLAAVIVDDVPEDTDWFAEYQKFANTSSLPSPSRISS
jgi:hypothetical protein